MNIKDTITELGLDVENLPRILKQRVETVEDLVSKVALAEKEVADEPTEESQAKLEEVTNYTDEYLKDVQEQLTSYKAKLDKKADEKAKADADADAKEKEKEKEVLEAKPVVEEEKKSSGMGALLIGGVLLVATLGAVNIMRKK
jgi:protein subunit release factor A|tara:strand:+ start:468 stop:899 length:432 start_codon:yes stop_codon:yes gene_type:complete